MEIGKNNVEPNSNTCKHEIMHSKLKSKKQSERCGKEKRRVFVRTCILLKLTSSIEYRVGKIQDIPPVNVNFSIKMQCLWKLMNVKQLIKEDEALQSVKQHQPTRLNAYIAMWQYQPQWTQVLIEFFANKLEWSKKLNVNLIAAVSRFHCCE